MNLFFALALLLFVYMTLWFFISHIVRRNDVADIAWGLGFVIVAWAAFSVSETNGWRAVLTNTLVTLWGLRLSLHIFFRNRGKAEDFRYENWRKQWGRGFVVRSFAHVYLFQGALLFIIALPVIWINSNFSGNFAILDLFGVILWFVGFLFESVSDWQLRQFKNRRENEGKIMQSGLWRYSRHPNYFGEVVQWWAVFLLAVATPNGWVTIVGPITITYVILFVSGVPLLERKYAKRTDFEKYKKTTSVFIPLPPRIASKQQQSPIRLL